MCDQCGCGEERAFGVEPMQARPGASAGIRLGAVSGRGRRLGEPHAPHGHAHDHPHAHGHEHGYEHGHGGQTHAVAVPLLARNALAAERVRGFLLGRGIRGLNLLSAPGAGKTTLVVETLRRLRAAGGVKAAVVVGDLATAQDARLIAEAGAPAVQITTGEACHLDAEMVARGLEELDLAGVGLLLIENVGNLVCPAAYDLGEAGRAVLFSVAEGEDKPLKYPPVFRSADLVLITKVELAGACGFDVELARRHIEAVKPGVRVLEVSARSGVGMEEWIGWLCGDGW